MSLSLKLNNVLCILRCEHVAIFFVLAKIFGEEKCFGIDFVTRFFCMRKSRFQSQRQEHDMFISQNTQHIVEFQTKAHFEKHALLSRFCMRS